MWKWCCTYPNMDCSGIKPLPLDKLTPQSVLLLLYLGSLYFGVEKHQIRPSFMNSNKVEMSTP